MKLLKINQLLFHPKSQCLSFFLSDLSSSKILEHERFLEDILVQLGLQGKKHLAQKFEHSLKDILATVSSHPNRAHGFFMSEHLVGYMLLENSVETYCTISSSFHIRPILEEVFINLEYILINISSSDIKIYQVDLKQIEFVKSFDFEVFESLSLPWEQSRVFSGDLSQLIPHRTMLNMKSVALRVMETMQIGPMPVLVTGNETLKNIFMRYYNHSYGTVDISEDFSESSCTEIMSRMKEHKQTILDFYSVSFKNRLLKLIGSGQLITDLHKVIRAIQQGEVLRLMIPVGKNLWGSINFKTGKYSLTHDMNSGDGTDILNELAEEVIRQGGKIQFLSNHFFPKDSVCMGIIKRIKRKDAA
jgi:hypothetical protein